MDAILSILPPQHQVRLKLAHVLLRAEARARLYRKLAALTQNGLQMQQAVSDLAKRASRKDAASLETMLVDVLFRIQAGGGLGAAMKGWAPTEEVMLLAAGERDSLPSALNECAELIDNDAKLRRAIRSAIAYPILLFCALLVLIFVFGSVLLPQVIEMVDVSQLRGGGSILYSVYTFVNSGAFVALAVLLVALIPIVLWSLPRWHGPTRVKFDRFPPWSFYRLRVGGAWMLSLAALLRVGVTLSDALGQMRSASMFSNPWLFERMDKALRGIAQGKHLGDALEASKLGFPDPEIIDDFVVYATLPDFEATLQKAAKQWIQTGVYRIEEQAGIMKNFAIVLMGLCVLAFFSGFVSMYQQVVIQVSRTF